MKKVCPGNIMISQYIVQTINVHNF